MVWSVSAGMRAAIDATGATTASTLAIWLDGDDGSGYDFTYLLGGWSVSRTPQDSGAGLMAGSTGATATITLSWQGSAVPGGDGRSMSVDFAPYVGTLASFLARDFGIGMRVQLRAGLQLPGGVETCPLFLGRIDSVDVQDDTTVVLNCQDYSIDLQDTADLPVVAVQNGSPGLPLYTVVEHLLRSGGFYRTPPPLDGCVLSVPAILPEIGDLAAPLYTQAVHFSGFSRYASTNLDNVYVATDSYSATVGDKIVIEGWWRAAAAPGKRVLVRWSDEVTGPNGLQLWIAASNRVVVSTLDESVQLLGNNTIINFPTDDTWHYLYVEVRFTATVATIFHRIDGVDGGDGSSLAFPRGDNLSRRVTLGGHVHEGVSIRRTRDARVVRDSWAPNYSTNLLGESPLIRSIPRGISGTVWELTRGIAVATGVVCRWREDGFWRWQERDSWAQRRTMAPVRTVDGDVLAQSGYSYDGTTRRKSVTIDWSVYQVSRSTANAPIWKTTDAIIIPASATTSLDFTTDQPVLGILPVQRTPLVSASYSSVQVVPAYQVGDAAAATVPGLIFRFTPTATGFRMVVKNPQPFDCALWDPITGNPFLVLQGYTTTGGQPQLNTIGASSRSREALVLDPSPWRQDRTTAVMMGEAIAAEVSLPAMQFGGQVMIADPTLTVDDMVNLVVPDIVPAGIPAQIVGINTTSDEQQTLTIRSAKPPVGWLLGVPGRSELGVTTPVVV